MLHAIRLCLGSSSSTPPAPSPPPRGPRRSHNHKSSRGADAIGDAVIVETRESPAMLYAMVSVLDNFRRTLDDRWTVHADVSPNMTSALDSQLRTIFHLRMALEKAALRVAPASIGNGYTEFNLMYTRPDFWRKYAAPYLLMFHIDSCLCPSPTRSLQSFIDSGDTVSWARHGAVGSVRYSVASPNTQKRTASATAVSRFGGATTYCSSLRQSSRPARTSLPSIA